MGKYEKKTTKERIGKEILKEIPSTKIEGNLVEYLPFDHADRKRDEEITRTFDVEDPTTGEIIQAGLTIRNPKGIFGDREQDLVVVIHKLLQEDNYPEALVFSVCEMENIMGIGHGGWQEKWTREGLISLHESGLVYDGLFKAGKIRLTLHVHFLEELVFYDLKEDKPVGIAQQQARKINILVLNRIFLKSLKAPYYANVYHEAYFSLPSGLPRALYLRLCKKNLWRTGHWKENYRVIANHLGMNLKQDKRHIIRTLDKAFNVLARRKLITCTREKEDYIFEPRYAGIQKIMGKPKERKRDPLVEAIKKHLTKHGVKAIGQNL